MRQLMGSRRNQLHRVCRLRTLDPYFVPFGAAFALFVESQRACTSAGDIRRWLLALEKRESHRVGWNVHLAADLFKDSPGILVASTVLFGKMTRGGSQDVDRFEPIQSEAIGEPLHSPFDTRLCALVERA